MALALVAFLGLVAVVAFLDLATKTCSGSLVLGAMFPALLLENAGKEKKVLVTSRERRARFTVGLEILSLGNHK